MIRAKQRNGFTLIELVIAIAIMSIIMTIAYSSLSYIIRTKKLLDDRREISSIANAVLLRVSREIQLTEANKRLMPVNGAANSGPVPYYFAEKKTLDNGKRADTLRFIAREAGQYIPGGQTNTGSVQISYRVEKDPDSPKGEPSSYLLIRDEEPHVPSGKAQVDRKMTFPIAKNLIRLEFDFYDSNADQWKSDWNSNTLPSLVRMILALRSPMGAEHEFVTVLPIVAK